MSLEERNNPLALLFEDVWITKLAFLTEVFGLLNDLNMKHQGKSGNI